MEYMGEILDSTSIKKWEQEHNKAMEEGETTLSYKATMS